MALRLNRQLCSTAAKGKNVDDKTLQALTTLAAKLGTTAEYMWGVLLRQAPITGAIDLAVMVAWVTMAVLLLRLVRRKTTKPAKTEEDRYPSAEWHEEGAVLAWAGAIGFALITALIVGSGLSSVAAALTNPEYWALKQILK